MGKKVIGYIRVSTEKQADSGLSLEYQESKIRAYCDLEELDLVEIVRDEGASAKSFKREGMQKVISMIKTKAIEGIVVLKLDRLTRSVKDLGLFVDLIKKYDVAFMCVQDKIDTSTPSGVLVLNVLGAVAQFEREAICDRTKAALSVKKANHQKTGGLVPYGFTLGADGSSLIPNLKEQKAINLIKKLREEGKTFQAIADTLNQKGIPCRKSDTWRKSSIFGILKAA